MSPTASQELDDIDDQLHPQELIDTAISVADTPEEARKKKIMLIALLVNTFACMCLYMNVSSLLPAYVDQNFHDELNALDVGILMAVFPVGFLIAAPLIGMSLEKVGRKNILYIGVTMMTLATLTFGLASYFTTTWIFYSVSMFARFMQGIANASINVTTPSIVA